MSYLLRYFNRVVILVVDAEGFHADVILKNNNMTRINGAAFKPILQSGSKLSFTTSKLPPSIRLVATGVD